MKKLIALLLAAVLCLSLPAYAGAESAEEEETVVAIVSIVIGPEYRVYVDGDGNVCQARCLDEDGEPVAIEADVIGEPWEDAVVSLLDEAATEGILEDGGEITLTVFIAHELAGQMDAWMDTGMESIIQVLESNDFGARITMDAQPTEIAQLLAEDEAAAPAEKATEETKPSKDKEATAETKPSKDKEATAETKPGKVEEATTAPTTSSEVKTYTEVQMAENGAKWELIRSAETGYVLALIITETDGTVTYSDYKTNTTTVTAPDGTTTQQNGVIGAG